MKKGWKKMNNYYLTDEDIHGCEEDDQNEILMNEIKKLRNELLDAYDIIEELKQELKKGEKNV
jgi:hypothetical protein